MTDSGATNRLFRRASCRGQYFAGDVSRNRFSCNSTIRAAIVTNNNVVVHKIWKGQPTIERYDDKAEPFGPLQTLNNPRTPIPF